MVRWNKSRTLKAPTGTQNVVVIDDLGITKTRPFAEASGIITINTEIGPDLTIAGGAGIAVTDGGSNIISIASSITQYTDALARTAVKYQPDVTLAGATPVRADVAAWANGDRGIGIGTGGVRYLIVKEGAALVHSVALAEVGA